MPPIKQVRQPLHETREHLVEAENRLHSIRTGSKEPSDQRIALDEIWEAVHALYVEAELLAKERDELRERVSELEVKVAGVA